MALFGRDPSRNYALDYRYGGGLYRDAWGRGYDIGYGRGEDASRFAASYDAGYRSREGMGRWGMRYDRGFYRRSRGSMPVDYKSRWQTDYGDPYGDREAHTPIRVIRGAFRGRTGRMGPDEGYDIEYTANPMNPPMYRDRSHGYDRFYRGAPRGYDYWF